MTGQPETMLGGEVARPFLHGAASDLHGFTAIGAHQVMVMMIPAQPVQRFTGIGVQNVHGPDLRQRL